MLKRIFVDYNPVVPLFSKLLDRLTILGDFANYLKDIIFNKEDFNLGRIFFLLG